MISTLEASVGSCWDKKGLMTSDNNKVKRMQFAKQCVAAKDTFVDVIWTNERSVDSKAMCE